MAGDDRPTEGMLSAIRRRIAASASVAESSSESRAHDLGCQMSSLFQIAVVVNAGEYQAYDLTCQQRLILSSNRNEVCRTRAGAAHVEAWRDPCLPLNEDQLRELARTLRRLF